MATDTSAEELEGQEGGEELYEQVNITVDPGQELLRIDKFLMDRMKNVSRNRLQNAAKAGAIVVNDKPVKSNYRVRPNDVVKVLVSNAPQEYTVEGEDIPLEIIYEDDDLLVLNKQADLVVHPGAGNWTGTLVNALTFHYDNLPDNGDITRGGLVHRLDKGTTGLMVVAKSEYALTHLAKQFFDRTIKRRYMALAWGDVLAEEGKIEVNIGRHERLRMKQDVFPEGDQGKHAITHYKVLERYGYTTLVECKLETGRTHQIRVHMQHLKHPLFNDATYGGDKILKGTVYTKYKQFVDNCFKILPRPALHAFELGFEHPTTGEFMEFEHQPPDDFLQLLDKWRNYYKNKGL